MSSYNERLDKLMPCDCKFLKGFAWREGDPCEGCINGRLKQALTSLTKELVAEAKPQEHIDVYTYSKAKTNGDIRKIAINQFEQNLLKALETRE